MTNSEIKKCDPKPCPFCPKSIVDPYFDDMANRWRVGCGRCGASSGIYKEKQKAIDAWNTRPPEPTKAENGLVKIADLEHAFCMAVMDSEEFKRYDFGAFVTYNKHTFLEGFKAIHNLIIQKQLATSSITKDQLLAILPEKENYVPTDKSSHNQWSIGFNTAIDQMKQRFVL